MVADEFAAAWSWKASMWGYRPFHPCSIELKQIYRHLDQGIVIQIAEGCRITARSSRQFDAKGCVCRHEELSSYPMESRDLPIKEICCSAQANSYDVEGTKDRLVFSELLALEPSKMIWAWQDFMRLCGELHAIIQILTWDRQTRSSHVIMHPPKKYSVKSNWLPWEQAISITLTMYLGQRSAGCPRALQSVNRIASKTLILLKWRAAVAKLRVVWLGSVICRQSLFSFK